MNIDEIRTPAILLDMDIAENNLRRYAEAARSAGKEIWPMTKTHKSTELARLQLKYGAAGLLCGTLDECEAFAGEGLFPIMYAYPIGSSAAADRLCRLASLGRVIARVDSREGAELLDRAAKKSGIRLSYTVIIDCGLGRFGIRPEQAGEFAVSLKNLENLEFCGISTHPGQVYGAQNAGEAAKSAIEEAEAVEKACRALRALGFEPSIVSSGSTPTFFPNINDKNLNIYHPGNYIYNDVIQLSIGAAEERDCALTVLATVISHPKEDLYICDAGAKCLGLDQGAHGNSSIKGYGRVLGHPELTVYSLSEEVGKLHAECPTSLKIGDRIRIIPNHACSTANLTSYNVAVRGEEVCGIIETNVRGNSRNPLG